MIQEEYNRYARQIVLNDFGIEGQLKLKKAKVLVIGAGGLGCPLLQYVVSSGIGSIGIVDGDQVSLSNLQRQILFSTDDIGKNKAQVASGKLQLLNPHVKIEVYPTYISATNCKEIMSSYDIIADCTDNFTTRYLINDAAVQLNKPVVYAALYKFQGQVSVFNFENGPSYRCLFPKDVTKTETENCSEAGIWPVLPGIVGCMQANELMKAITGTGTVLSGALLTYDSKTNATHILKFKRNDYQISLAQSADLVTEYCPTPFDKSLDFDHFNALSHDRNTLTVDLREPEELTIPGLQGAVNYPFSKLENWKQSLPKDQKILLYCSGGKRSQKILEVLLSQGYDGYELKNGLPLQNETSLKAQTNQ